MKINCPCKGCTDRHINCHSQCANYAEYRTALQAQKEAQKADYELQSFLFCTKRAIMEKGRKRMYYEKKVR